MGNGIGQAASTAKTATFTEMKAELEKTGDDSRSIRAGKNEVWTNKTGWTVASNLFFGIGKFVRACFGEKSKGVQAVKDAINRDFGVKIGAATGQPQRADDFADTVIGSLYKQNKISSRTDLKVGDLEVIKQEIERYSSEIEFGGRIVTAERAATRLILGQSNVNLRAHDDPTVGEDVQALTKAIEDKSLPKEVRDKAVSALKAHFEPILNIDDKSKRLEAFEKSMQRQEVLKFGDKSVRQMPLPVATYNALFRVTDGNGELIIPKEVQKQLALDAIDQKVAQPKFDSANSFLRNDALETKLCTAALQNLDDGVLGKIVKGAERVVEVANLQIEEAPCTKKEDARTYRNHYLDETGRALGGAMKEFEPVCNGVYKIASDGNLSETRLFLAEIAKRTDDANVTSNKKYSEKNKNKQNDAGMQAINSKQLRKGQKNGETIALQLFVLRGINGSMTENAKNLPEERAEMTTAFTKTLQLAISGNYEFDKGNEGTMPEHARAFDNSLGMIALKDAIAVAPSKAPERNVS